LTFCFLRDRFNRSQRRGQIIFIRNVIRFVVRDAFEVDKSVLITTRQTLPHGRNVSADRINIRQQYHW